MLRHLTIENFKSIASADIEFHELNVLIGANGSGKSNLVAFFKMIRALMAGELQDFISQSGGAQACLHTCASAHEHHDLRGRLEMETSAGIYGYELRLAPLLDSLVFAEEALTFQPADPAKPLQKAVLGSGHQESVLATHGASEPLAREIIQLLGQCAYYQFHDTSSSAAMKQGSVVEDQASLSNNGSNLPSYLYYLRTNFPDHYLRIIEIIRQVFPHFSDFQLEPRDRRLVQLDWREENCDTTFNAHQLSDGTLRFIALATLLLQPEEKLPKVILIDEPELGLHPFAIQLLASLIDHAATHSQIILATQSVDLVDCFEPDKIIIAERPDHETVFRRLEAERYAEWLQSYSLGDLWKKNVIGGRPSK